MKKLVRQFTPQYQIEAEKTHEKDLDIDTLVSGDDTRTNPPLLVAVCDKKLQKKNRPRSVSGCWEVAYVWGGPQALWHPGDQFCLHSVYILISSSAARRARDSRKTAELKENSARLCMKNLA